MKFYFIVFGILWFLSVVAGLFSFIKNYSSKPREPKYVFFPRYFIYYLLLFLFSFIFLHGSGYGSMFIHVSILEACFCLFYAICNWCEFKHAFKYLFRCYFGFMCRKKTKVKRNTGIPSKKVVWI